jgi:hypothetical protein
MIHTIVDNVKVRGMRQTKYLTHVDVIPKEGPMISCEVRGKLGDTMMEHVNIGDHLDIGGKLINGKIHIDVISIIQRDRTITLAKALTEFKRNWILNSHNHKTAKAAQTVH